MKKQHEWIDKDSLFALLKADHGSIRYVLELFLSGGRQNKVRSFARFILNSPENTIDERELDAAFWIKCKASEFIEYENSASCKGRPTGRLSLSVPGIVNFKTCMIYFHRQDANDYWFGGSNSELISKEFPSREFNQNNQSEVIKQANKGGAPTKHDWEGAFIEMARVAVFDENCDRDAITRAVQNWFVSKGKEASPSQIRDKVKRFYETLWPP